MGGAQHRSGSGIDHAITDALSYPGPLLAHPAVLTRHGWDYLDEAVPRDEDALDAVLTRAGGVGMRARTLVIAIGSNGSAEWVWRKLVSQRVVPVVPLVPGVVTGLAAGHSAHVSLGGYVAAAPYDDPRGSSRVVAGWFDDEQLAALDWSEPNYGRVAVGAQRYPVSLLARFGPSRYQIYRSRWGVLSHQGHVLAMRSQSALHSLLRGGAMLPAPITLGGASGAIHVLRDRQVQQAVRRHWAHTGQAVSDGIHTLGQR